MPSLVTLVDGTVPVAADFNGNYSALNNAIGSSTAISAWATGEIPYASAANTLSRLSPGSVGKVLTMTSTIPNWEGGAWSTPAFNAGDFTASGAQTWTVAAGDVGTSAYVKIGKTMVVTFRILTTTVGGTPSPELRMLIPGGFAAAKVSENTIRIIDNGTAGVGLVATTASGTNLVFYKDQTALANWTAATDATAVIGTHTFETT